MKQALGAVPPAPRPAGGPAARAAKRRGATLLVSIAILTLLAVFSIAFVQLVNFERRASANYIDAVRARMAARAGVQRAIAELQRIAARKHYSDARPTADGGDGWAFSYRTPEKDGGNSAGRPSSLLTTTRPSFRMTDTGRMFFNRPLEYSGEISSSYNLGLDVYKLKILDAASQLNVNHPDDASVARMLKNLLLCASDLDTDTPAWGLSAADAAQLAQAVVTRRPRGGFRSLSEVEQILAEPLLGAGSAKNVVVRPGAVGTLPDGVNRWLYPDRDGLRLPLRDMLTVSSWVDESVIRPWNLNGVGRRDLSTLPRAPVNLNTAPLPVLTGVLAELSGAGRFGAASLDYASARALGNAIRTRVTQATNGGPFRTWPEFERWLDQGPWTPGGSPPSATGFAVNSGEALGQVMGSGRRQLQRDLVKAALNPNSMLNKFGAHANHGGSRQAEFALPRLLDKSDLVQHGTEGCFDSMGVYDITSLGMVLVQNEREATGLLVLAEQTQQVVVRVYDVLRMTTQADFETNRAFMAQGDFIEAFDRKWTYTVPGVNRPRYGPPHGETVPRAAAPWGFEGWPGVTSLPVYSLHRDTKEKNFPMRPQYVAADWDGSLMLSNLLAVPVQPSDFVVCLARGGLDAFKVRVWWEPKDQIPTSGEPVDPTRPTRGHDPTNDPATSFRDLRALAAPMGYPPSLGGHKSSESNPLDAVAFGADALATNADFFEQGSALTPHGAIIHPRRQAPDAAGKPSVLAYDGNNIDLIQGTSIRFWVMPTDDPYAQTEEVLFSFVGSKDGITRDVGFKVEKRALGGAVRIFLKTINRAGAENDVRNGAGAGLGTPNEISVDVTPDEGVVPNPLRPQWTPGSWHWIVINFGPQTSIPNVAQTAVLQVDKARGNDIATDIINMSVSGTGGALNYGAAHGNQSGDGVIPGGNLNINRTGVVAWVSDRLLGEWYHCDAGKNVNPEDDERTYPDAVQWDPDDGGGAGGYVISPSFPANPFPDGSYNRQLELRFYNADGTASGLSSHPAQMTPANGTGMGGTGWTYNFNDVDMGKDLTGGTSDDYRIDIVAKWTMDTVGGGSCDCCSDCGTHDMTRKRYWGRNNDNGGSICYMVHKGPGLIIAGGRLAPPNALPLQFTCDQCHGCEACDVDGPMFFGGEPQADNYVGGVLAPMKVSTAARAIFDNIIIKNNKERRTDAPGPGEQPGKDFEDRFFETSLATAAGAALNELNFGAIYRRGLLEVLGFRTRLGTLSWTSYPTSDGDYDFLASLYRMPGGTPSNARMYDAANPGPLNAQLAGAPAGQVYTMTVDGNQREIGYRFDAEPLLDTTSDPSAPAGSPYPRELLVLSVQFSKLLSSVNDRDADDGSGGKLYPQPLAETPVFEDVTLTLILESPQVLYAEEGVEE